jgi:hypothetical protein
MLMLKTEAMGQTQQRNVRPERIKENEIVHHGKSLEHGVYSPSVMVVDNFPPCLSLGKRKTLFLESLFWTTWG